jgi:hypothetical protein
MAPAEVAGSQGSETTRPQAQFLLRWALRSSDGADRKVAASGRRLPRLQPRRWRMPDFPRRRRPAAVPGHPGEDGRTLRLGYARVLPDGQPLPPRRGLHPRTALDGDAAPERTLRAGLQPSPWASGPSLRPPVRSTRARRRRPPRRRRRLRPRQSRPGRPLRRRRRLALERDSLRPRPPPTSGGSRGRAGARRRDSRYEPGRPGARPEAPRSS